MSVIRWSHAHRARVAVAAVAIATAGLIGSAPLAAQEGPERGQGATRPGFAAMDPIGFLLEHRDSLRLADSVVMQLVRVNMRLFRQNRQLQMRLDSILPVGMGGMAPMIAMDPPAGAGGSGGTAGGVELPDSVRDQVRALVGRMRENARVAQDAAMVLLTDSQKVRARDLQTAALLRQGAQGGQRSRRP